MRNLDKEGLDILKENSYNFVLNVGRSKQKELLSKISYKL